MGTSWVAVSINNIKTRASREMTSRKNINIFDFNGVNVAKHWHVAGEVFVISDCLVVYCVHTGTIRYAHVIIMECIMMQAIMQGGGGVKGGGGPYSHPFLPAPSPLLPASSPPCSLLPSPCSLLPRCVLFLLPEIFSLYTCIDDNVHVSINRKHFMWIKLFVLNFLYP